MPLSFLLSIGLLLGCPASARTPDPVAPPADPALWVVQDADTTIYLFGTVHVLKPGTVWFEREIRTAFDASDELVLEMVEPDPAVMAQKAAALGIDPDGPPLSQKLSEADRAAYIAAMTGLGLPWQAFEALEPWMAGLTLTTAPLGKLGYTQDAGVEQTLVRAAKTSGKGISGLETADQQLGFFDGLDEKAQLAFLTAAVEGVPKVEQEFAMLVASWSAGKPDALADQMNASLEATPDLARVLLFDRNATWARWIAARMDRPGTLFIAVGAGHLAGSNDVKDRLAALGLTVRRVDRAKAAVH